MNLLRYFFNRVWDLRLNGSVMKPLKRNKNKKKKAKTVSKVKKTFKKSVKSGVGLVDKLIDKLPFELHLPSYNYCGPGMIDYIFKG